MDSEILDLSMNKEEIYELLFSSQQPKANDFGIHYCNFLFPHVQQQIINKMQEDCQQTIIEIQGKHQSAITDCDNQIQTI